MLTVAEKGQIKKNLTLVSFRLGINVVVQSALVLLRSNPLTRQEQVLGVYSIRTPLRLLGWIQFLTIVVGTHSVFPQMCVTDLTVRVAV